MRNKISLNVFSMSVLFISVLASISFALGKSGDTIPITTNSKEAKAEFLKGRDLFEKLRATDANEHFKKAHELDKNFAQAYYFDAVSSPTTKGYFEQIDEAWKLKDNASEGERLLIIASKAGTSGDIKTQEASLKKLVSLYPKDARAYNQLGLFYFGLQKFQACIDNLKKATQLEPGFSLPYNMLGYSYRSIGNYNKAEEAFKTYIKVLPDDPNPYDSYAELLLKEGKYKESISQYEKALSHDPHFVASYFGMATDYNFLGENKTAREKITKMLKDVARTDGEKRGAYFAMVVSYVDEGDMENAMKQMQNEYAIAEKSNDMSSMSADLNAMGNILFEFGKYDEANNKYKESLNKILNSNLSEANKNNSKRFSLYNEARIALVKGDLKTARSKANELLKKAGEANNNFQMWLSHEVIGSIAIKEKDYDKAISEFNKSNMQNPYTYYRIAWAYDENGKKEEAQKYYKQAANFNALNNLNQSFVRQKAEKMISSM